MPKLEDCDRVSSTTDRDIIVEEDRPDIEQAGAHVASLTDRSSVTEGGRVGFPANRSFGIPLQACTPAADGNADGC